MTLRLLKNKLETQPSKKISVDRIKSEIQTVIFCTNSYPLHKKRILWLNSEEQGSHARTEAFKMKRSNPLITCMVLSLMSMFMRYTNAKSYQVKIYIFIIWFLFFNFPLSVSYFFLSFPTGNPSLVNQWRKRGNFRTPICGKWWELKTRKYAILYL